MTDHQFTITRTFDAPRELVWRAWTEPTFAAQWWHPRDVDIVPESVQIDLRPGGTFHYTMVDAEGTTYPTAGTYLEVVQPRRLRFTWRGEDDADEESPVVTVDLDDVPDGRTTMTFHLLGIRDDRGSRHSVYDGWSSAFDLLADALAAGFTMQQAEVR